MVVHLKLEDDSEEYVDVVRMRVHDYVENTFLLDLSETIMHYIPPLVNHFILKKRSSIFDTEIFCKNTLRQFYNCRGLSV